MFNYLSNSFIKINPIPRSLGINERVTNISINNMNKSTLHTSSSYVSRTKYDYSSLQYPESHISVLSTVI